MFAIEEHICASFVPSYNKEAEDAEGKLKIHNKKKTDNTI